MAKRRSKDKDSDQLFAQMMRLVGEGSSIIAAMPPAPRVPAKRRLALFEKAFKAKDPATSLARIRDLVPDEGNAAHDVVVYGHACILETNSAGLSIVFDRFDAKERARIARALKQIGAVKTLKDFEILRARRSAARLIDRKSDAHVREMESKLLAFCRKHVDELAAD